MQAVSGAGYPGVPSLDIVDNILPYIDGEEEKVENEPLKMFGSISDEPEMNIKPANFIVSASCQRVNTIDGHFEDLHISLGREARIDEVKKVLANFDAGMSDLPTAPKSTIIVTDDPKRPQTRLDRNTGQGMTITVGRVRKDLVLENGIKMSILGHNTIRGAAGQSIMNAEWWVENMRQ